MSLEFGRKFGLIASLINVIMPIVVIVGVIAFIVSLIASTGRIVSGSAVPGIVGFSITFVAFIAAIAIVAIIGFILFMIAMYNLSHYYNEPGIFKNVLYAFLINIVSGVALVIFYVAVLFSTLGNFSGTTAPANPNTFFSQFILSYVLVFGVAIALGLVYGFLYMRAFNKLKEKSGVDSFGTAGILYLIGIIIPFIAWIGWIFAAIGFQRLKPTPISSVSYPAQPPPSFAQTKRCPNCGTDNYGDASYCRTCGKTLQ